MVNNEAGAFLNITPDVLKKLDSFDEKLEKIEKHAHTAANALKNGFGSVVVDTSKLESAITSLANKIGALNTAGRAVGNIGTSMNEVSKDATRAASSLSSVAQTLNRVKPDNGLAKSVEQYRNISAQIEQISSRQKQLNDIVKSYELTMSRIQSGKGGIIQAGQQQQVQSARQELEANNQLLATLRQKQQEIVNTNKAYQQQVQLAQQLRNLEQERNSLPNQRSKQTLADMRAYYSELEKSSARAAKAAEQATERESRADEKRYNEWLRRKAHEEKEALRISNAKAKAEEQAMRASLLAYRNTPQGALDYSKNAKSLRDQVTAINYLKQARLSLNTTDKNYQSTLQQINLAISRHNQALQQAGVQSQSLARNHRNLMDTAGQLSRQLALVFSVSQIEGYISKLANVRGEFELQQRSLQAILQNKSQADQIFNKTVQLAVKSPFQIKELVTFTKQLAAYRIESDKLYDTTKRLADVSAGLGVDMGRLILAYGQVKAAAYLRGTEVRQFTEAGINLYGELQRYFEEVKGEAYTTAQIVDMISKRKVTFEDIENIFKRLTDSGGLFYNMQEIQAETLQGKISNLKDSIDVMLNSIGKANEDTLKGSIDAVKVLIDNWETVVDVAKVFGAIIGAMGLTAWSKKLGVANSNVALLSAGITRLTATMKMLKTAFMTSLPTAGIFLAIEALTELIQVYSEYNKSISESNTKYFKNRVVLAEIDKESESDIKTALTKLVNAMNNEGFEIEIKANISEDEAKKEFDRYKQMYEDFLYDMLVLEQKYAENKERGWANPFADKAFVDDIDTNAKEYKESLAEFVAGGEKIRAVLLEVSEKSTILTKTQAEQFKTLAAGPDKGENVINYYERLAKALEEVGYKADEAYGGKISKQNVLGGEHQTKGVWGVGKELDRQMAGFSTSFITMQRDLERFRNDARSIFGEVREDLSDEEKNKLKVRIDKLATIAEWDEIVKDVIYQDYKIDVKVNADTIEAEMDGLDKIFKLWFSKHTYNLNISYGDLGNKDGFKGFLEQGDEMAAAYKKAELSAKRLKNAADAVFNQRQSGLTKEQFQNAFGLVETVSKKQLIKYYEEYAKASKQAAIDAGWTEDEKKKDRSTRDIWAERISVLKEMQSRYEKLNQLMGENRAIEETRSAFKGALDFTQMGEVIKAEDIIPTKQGMIDALEKLLEQIPNDVKNAAKRTGLEKEIAELKIGIQQDYLKEQLDKTKQNIESMFNGLDLHQKLKDAGLSEAEVQALFPGLAKTLDDVEKEMKASYEKNFPKGEYLVADTDANKQYLADLDKLNQQRIKEQQDLVIELTKAYKTQLSDQLQLGRWYYEEKAKIAKANLTDEQRTQYNKNLTKQYSEKSDENAWKQFQESDFYIDLFQNLDNVSTKTLVAMRNKLSQMKEQLNDLQPSQVRAIVNNMEKLNEVLAGRNPFKELIPNLKSYIGSLKDRKKHEDEYIKALEEQEKVEKRLYGYTKINEDGSKEKVIGESELVARLQAEYDAIIENKDATEEQKEEALEELEIAKNLSDLSEIELANNKEITNEKKAQVDADRKKLDEANKNLNEVAKYGAEAVDAVSEFTGMLEGFGVEIPEWLKGTTEGLGQIFDGLGSIDLTRPFSIVSGAFKTVAGIGKTIGSIFGIGNKDKKKEREIQRQIKNIETLGKAYDELKEKMEAAWSADDLRTQTKDTVANLDSQIASYQAMIKAEEDKKKTDHARIEEWQDAIEELKKTKQEILNQEKIEMGGIGGESEYKDAASSFVQAWLDAFNETGDGLKGLEENFDDFINNLFLKQASMRIANKFLEPLFQMIDLAVTEGEEAIRKGFDGDTKVTRQEMDKIVEEAKKQFPQLSEALEELYNSLGIKDNKKAELSALQQGIQAMSEETAGELQALLNSIRFFVSQQTTDISAIRTLLDARYGLETEYSDSNPMLVELRAQTGYLEILSDRIDRVFAPSPNSKGAGLRVYMQ